MAWMRGYGRGIDAAKRAGVELVDTATRQKLGRPQELILGGRVISPAYRPRYPANPFADKLKTAMPWEVVPRLIVTNSKLKDWDAWYKPENVVLDVSL